jgi:hypothetical protein
MLLWALQLFFAVVASSGDKTNPSAGDAASVSALKTQASIVQTVTAVLAWEAKREGRIGSRDLVQMIREGAEVL